MRFLGLLVVLCLLVCPVWAAEFSASVERDVVVVGEPFVLQLSLSGSSAKGRPDISVLERSFEVVGQKQGSRTSIVNGHLSSSASWYLTLSAKKPGVAVIPAIAVESSSGLLRSRSIRLQVKSAADLPSVDSEKRTRVVTTLSKKNPFKNEPVVLTIQVLSRFQMANVHLGELVVKDAIVEPYGEPRSFQTKVNGVVTTVIEARHVITPLKDGRLVFPATLIKGDLVMRRSSRRRSLFDLFDQRGVPFSLASDEIVVNVGSPVSSVSPWFPASSFKISEAWDDGQTVVAGEPLVRQFVLVVEGALAHQIPGLSVAQVGGDGFKVYADKPVVENDFRNGEVAGWREEKFTLIPQEAGEVVLPEVVVPWWDVVNDKKAFARISARKVVVQPGAVAPVRLLVKEDVVVAPVAEEASEGVVQAVGSSVEGGRFLVWVIGGLLGVLCLVLVWVGFLCRKIRRLSDVGVSVEVDEVKDVGSEVDLSWRAFDAVDSAEEVRGFVLAFAFRFWGGRQNMSLGSVADLVCVRFGLNRSDVVPSFQSLEAALYGGKAFDVDVFKHWFARLSKSFVARDVVDDARLFSPLNLSK